MVNGLIVELNRKTVQERLQILDEQCYITMKGRYRPKSVRNKKCQINIYFKFCEFYGLQPFPAEEWQLIRYSRYIANTSTSFGTVENHISNIRTMQELAGISMTPKMPNLAMHLESIDRELARPTRQSVPIGPELLARIYEKVDTNSIKEVVCYTTLVLGFYLFSRKSNLVPDSRTTFNPKEQLCRKDARFEDPLTLIDIRWAKNHQKLKKELLLPLIKADDKRVCPIFWVRVMLNLVPGDPEDPLFQYMQMERGRMVMVPVTYYQLRKFLLEKIQLLGLDTTKYGLHGLRRAGATHALESGLASEDIRLMGGWASDAYMTYIDLNTDRRVDNMVKFVAKVDEMLL